MRTKLISPYYRLTPSEVIIYKNYSWDGPSGPTIDSESSLRASLIHDVLYQISRKYYDRISDEVFKAFRKAADDEFRVILKDDGMPKLRRWIWWGSVRLFGKNAAIGKEYRY